MKKKISCRDIHYKRKEVATSSSSRDNKRKDLRSRHHSVVMTSAAKDSRSRHHSEVATEAASEEVATSARCRNITYKESRSRHELVVATSIVKNQGRDIIQLS